MDDIVWSYQDGDWDRQSDLVGYDVEATDGKIGSVHEASTEAAASWIVVDTGPWILGKRRLIPAGTVSGVHHDKRLVIVNMSKDQIKDAPDYDKDSVDETTMVEHSNYYAPSMGKDEG